MNETEHSKTIERIFELWKSQNPHVGTSSTHECPGSSCRVVNVVGCSHLDGGVSLLSPNDPHPPDILHRYDQLYVCLENGEPHWCGDRCEFQERDEYGYVCRLSGRRCESAISDTWIPQYRISATSQESKDPKALGVHADESSGVIKSMKHVDYAAKIVFNLLFSTTRLYAEQRKYADQRVESEKAVARYMKSQESKGEPSYYTAMLETYIHTMRSRRIFFALVPKCTNAEKLSHIYAKKICQFWRVITQKTPMGQSSPNTFSFQNFACPALYMMRTGLVISNVAVIKRCQLLSTLLPEANTLDNYKVSKPLFTSTKNAILRSLREAVDVYKIPAQELVTF